MPAFVNSPFQNATLLQKGVPAYFFGSFSQQRGNTHLGLLTDAIASNVATITGQFVNGPLPLVGDLVSIINSANSSGAFNVNRAIITAVSYNVSTNVMTITFALTGSNQSATADGGTVRVEPAETSEALANNSFSRAVFVQAPEGDAQFSAPISVTFPTLPTAVTVSVQYAIKGQSNEWTTLAQIAIVAAGAQTVGPVSMLTLQRAYLYRLAVTSLTGTGTIIAKIGG
jgi:uncharacterized membrane protein